MKHFHSCFHSFFLFLFCCSVVACAGFADNGGLTSDNVSLRFPHETGYYGFRVKVYFIQIFTQQFKLLNFCPLYLKCVMLFYICTVSVKYFREKKLKNNSLAVSVNMMQLKDAT